jgi:Ca2+-binding RTX toxin-like protein
VKSTLQLAAWLAVKRAFAHTRIPALCGIFLVIVGVQPAAAAAESCTYDGGTRVVTATISTGSAATLEVAATGELLFGAIPAPCGAATTTNTNFIQVSGAAGSVESLTIDQSDGFLGPGFSSEGNLPEIEVTAALGDASDQVIAVGTSGNDAIAIGGNGLSLNNDGDVDVTFAPLPAHVEIQGLGGVNQLTGRGGWGAGAAYNGSVTLVGGSLGDTLNGGNGADTLTGGAGNDTMNGNDGNDSLDGAGGNDKVNGGAGTDHLVGGPGSDTFTGGFGNDFLVAFDGEADASINGGPDTDTAFYDAGIDPNPTATETSVAGPPNETCSYDPSTKAVTARPEPGGTATLKVAANGDLLFGFVPQPCGGATTTNTDSFSVTGYAGLNEKLIVDQTDGVLGPGFTSEFNIPEIELATNLGDAADTIVVYGTPGNDLISPGQNGIALNSDGDLDVTVNPGAFLLEIRTFGGDDFVNGRGQGGSGLHFLGPLIIYGGDGADELVGSTEVDKLYGEGGNDTVNAQASNDLLEGGPGDDFLTASEGNDTVVGGPGADNMSGGFGDDFIDADDGEADTQIHGGPDTDTAFYDAGIDPGAIAVENAVPDPGQGPPPPPPPPPPGACSYDAQAKVVTATMPTAGEATLAVAGGEIRFGTTPVACGSATTANTDSIAVGGPSGSTERLVVDESSGLLAPGATPETTGSAEIEMAFDLGDAADQVVVIGGTDNDTLAAGANGLSMNADGDLDVTFAILPAVIELRGGGGVNFLSGRGGFGAGLQYPGQLVLVAGDLGDEINGAGLGDVIVGGAGNDTVQAFGGNDTISGNGGNDFLNGSDGNDMITGGAGADSFVGGFDNDTLFADDDEADTQINGGPGSDTAYYDLGIDPGPSAVETLIPA